MKRILLLVILAMLMVVTPLNAASAPKMLAYVDKNNQSFIPVSLLKTFEGIQVSYTAAEKKLRITKDNKQLTLYLGSRTAYIDGKKRRSRQPRSPRTASHMYRFSLPLSN